PEAEDFVGLLAAGAEDEDRRFRAVGAQCAQHAVAVQAGKHEVEDDHVGRAGARALESRVAVARQLHLIAFDLEVVAPPHGEVAVVFDHENARHRRTPASALSLGASCSAGSTSGNATPKQAPELWGASSIHTSPFCIAASSRTT